MTMTWEVASATTIIYIARIKSINQNLYETVSLDGAIGVNVSLVLMGITILHMKITKENEVN